MNSFSIYNFKQALYLVGKSVGAGPVPFVAIQVRAGPLHATFYQYYLPGFLRVISCVLDITYTHRLITYGD